MDGTLHIFRHNVGNGAPRFQVNYTFGDRTFARVLTGEHSLRDFLLGTMALDPSDIDEVWHQLLTGPATLDGISLTDNDASAAGMTEAPSDF